MLHVEHSILGIDPGDHLGHCLLERGKLTRCGTWTYKKPRNGFTPAHRWLSFLGWFEDYIREMKAEAGLDLVVYEAQLSFRSHRATEVLKGYVNHIQTTCGKAMVECIPVPIPTLKKFATGRGDATKEQMAYWLRNRLMEKRMLVPEEISDHEVDAAWATLWGADVGIRKVPSLGKDGDRNSHLHRSPGKVPD